MDPEFFISGYFMRIGFCGKENMRGKWPGHP
jgi:hypothetical protein